MYDTYTGSGGKMRILLLSDTESKYIWDHFDAERFEDIELVISCGDLKSEYLSFIATMIKAVSYTHLFLFPQLF